MGEKKQPIWTVCMYVCMYVCVCVCVGVCKCVCMLYVCMYVGMVVSYRDRCFNDIYTLCVWTIKVSGCMVLCMQFTSTIEEKARNVRWIKTFHITAKCVPHPVVKAKITRDAVKYKYEG